MFIKKLLGFLKKKSQPTVTSVSTKTTQKNAKIQPARIGEIGEYKINIQLDQFSKDCRHFHDLLVSNPRSKTGYSQIDHVLITPYAVFVIETKNYSGEIKGNRKEKNWTVSNRFKMYNPILQNYGHIKVVEGILSDFQTVPFISMISFTMRARFNVDPELRKIGSNELVVYDVELKSLSSENSIGLN